ncbi:hypothetical protein L6164_012486 [Bauhinia variegata]|uniref:Uncharacterized protein n=1 Tax=Bauhinia variegata TaxID=167791 RepID=A0ACB9P9D0_BAUVA|nr:hypothetical protein L6164_012486 [Bauhinia variegata]
MGKKVRKKSRSSAAKEKQIVATHSPNKVTESSNSTVESVDDGVSVVKEMKSCPHLQKGVNIDKLSSKFGSSRSVRCEDCREGAADRRAAKSKVKHGKKEVGNSVDSKSESKAIWVCLECGHYSCGGVGLPVTPLCHVVRHSRKIRHPLVVNFENPLLCWCFPCSMLIPVEKMPKTEESTRVLSNVVKLLKGRSSEDVEDVWFGDGSVTSEIKSKTLLESDSYGTGSYIVRGMVNLGNTCFFNSIMQNLLAIDRLRDKFLKLDTSFGPLTSSLNKLYSETNPESGLKNSINPRSIFGSVCSKAPQFRGYQQHDSHELLHCLLDGLCTEELAVRKQKDLPKEDRTSFSITTTVDALFGGQISSAVCCTECGHSSTLYEPFLDLSLPVPTKKPPPRKAQQVSRTKKPNLPPKKGGKTQAKASKDTEPLPVQRLSAQSSSIELSCRAQSDISAAEEVVASSSGDSTVLGSEERGNVADQEDSTLPNHLTVQDSGHVQVVDNPAEKTSASLDDFSWLDYVEGGAMTDEHDLTSQENDVSVTQDIQSKEKPLKEFPVHVACESSTQVDEEQNPRPDSSSGNGWEEEATLQIQTSEVLLLPYKEESFSTGETMVLDGQASSSAVGCGQEELEFNGFGDLFNEPEIVAGPAPRPSSSADVMESGFTAGQSSESDPDEVDDTDSLVSVESCLAHFIKPELLTNGNAWHCENCSKVLHRQKLEAKKQAKSVSMGIKNRDYTGSLSYQQHSAHSCPPVVRILGNGDIKHDKVRESMVSSVKNCSNLENGQTDELSTVVDTHDEEFKSLGSNKTCNEESCNVLTAGSCSTHHTTQNVQRRDFQLLDGKKDSEEDEDEEVDSKGVKVKRDATKRVFIYKAPPVLTIHLKRFSPDARGRLSKLNGHINFREIIDLRPYMDPRCINEESCYEYHLVGVVEHSGTMRGGHYVAYVRGGQRNGGKADNKNDSSTWYHASDTYVREVSLDEVLCSEAYILFFEKT